jgi:hypothetical protein
VARTAAMPAKVFISQGAIDDWVSSERVEIQGSSLTFKGRPGAVELVPASLFRHISAGQTDPHSLVGKVLDEEAILALGGETYMSSVLLGETAYDIEPGFLGLPAGNDLLAVVASLRALET